MVCVVVCHHRRPVHSFILTWAHERGTKDSGFTQSADERSEAMASILIIDDDLQIRSLFGQILERIGHCVLTASNGNEGVQLFRQTPGEESGMNTVVLK